MSIIIISNNPKFICHYDEAELPSCDYSKLEVKDNDGKVIGSKPRDFNFLISQMVGAYLMGNEPQFTKIYGKLIEQIDNMSKSDDHQKRIAEYAQKRIVYAMDNIQRYASKYIILWHEQKTKR